MAEPSWVRPDNQSRLERKEDALKDAPNAVVNSGVSSEKRQGASKEESFTQKERLLLAQIKQTFDELGPEAMQLMELIVTKSNTKTAPADEDHAAANPGITAIGSASKLPSLPSVPSLRAIERFFLRLNDSEVAYWRVRPMVEGECVVPPEVCAGDEEFMNRYHVVPVHVFASLKRMATQWQKRYVDNFGRRTKAVDWPFPTTICQSNCFGWLFTEQILQRLKLLAPIHALKPSPSTNTPTPTHTAIATTASAAAATIPAPAGVKRGQPSGGTGDATDSVQTSRAKGNDGSAVVGGGKKGKGGKKARQVRDEADGPKGKPRELYLYHYPRYVRRPPMEGASPEAPDTLLPLMSSTKDVVERHYASVVERLLYQTVITGAPSTATTLIDDSLPYLAPLPPTTPPVAPRTRATTQADVIDQVFSGEKEDWEDDDGVGGPVAEGVGAMVERGSNLPAFLFESIPWSRLVSVGVASHDGAPAAALPLMAQDPDKLAHASLAPVAVLAKVDVAQRARMSRSGGGAAALDLSAAWLALDASTADPEALDLRREPRKRKTTKKSNSQFSDDDDDDDDADHPQSSSTSSSASSVSDNDDDERRPTRTNNKKKIAPHPTVTLIDLFQMQDDTD